MQEDYIDAVTGSEIAVHTGFPNPAIDVSLQELDLNRLLIPHGASTYLMRVAGNEYQSVGIFADDIAVIDKALTPRASDLIVWWHEGQFTISQLRRLPRGATAWGVVTATIHQLRGTS